MEHLNYCRQAELQARDWLKTKPLDSWQEEAMVHLVIQCIESNKFMLPVGGRLYDDVEFKALDENEPLRLPFPVIALEYQTGFKPITKKIVFAREVSDGIALMPVDYTENLKAWIPTPECFIPSTSYLDRLQTNEEGRVGIRFVCGDLCESSDYIDEIGALLCFLNSLQCSNVKIEKSNKRNIGKSIKAALPFDDYHILTISTQSISEKTCVGNSVRSPREHVRRGHIRKLQSGRKIWINTTMVNVGSCGKVEKDYLIRSRNP